MHRILLVEDSSEIQVLVQALLGREYVLVCASSADAAHKALEGERYDLILLDVNLPDGNGFEICARLRALSETRAVPVIFLTSRSAINEKVVGFSLGADDYVTKPFDPVELKARIQARIARASQGRASSEWLIRGDLRFHLPSITVLLSSPEGDQRLELTALEFRLLHYLATHEDMVLSRERLLNDVWGDGVHVQDRSVDGHMSTLRKKIKDSTYAIRAVYGEGYIFAAKKKRASKKAA